jgi:hypothetical protein
MSRVFTSEGTGAAVYVFSDDHCPPHVHARHRGDGWIARVRFSYLGSAVDLVSIAPLRNSPLQRTVNHLLSDIRVALPACRRIWWLTKRTTCLTNQWVVVLAPERIQLSPEPVAKAKAKQIADAIYDPNQKRLRVIFKDGTTADVSTRP